MTRRLAIPVLLLAGGLCLGQPGCRGAPAEPGPARVGTFAWPDGGPLWRAGRITAVPEHWDARGVWVGEDLCFVCHAEAFDALEVSPHAALLTGEEGWGCESCHGPGEAHEESEDPSEIERFAGLGVPDTAAICARCHAEDLRLLDARGGHAGADRMACTTCHVVHTPGGAAGGPQPDCADCHAGDLAAHDASVHAALVRGPGAVACATCHGPGEEHVAARGAPGTIGLVAIPDGDCAACHRDAVGARWRSSAHQRAGLGCGDCHDALQPAGRPTPEPEVELCGDCHAGALAEFHLPFGHPVLQGAMGCSACHDVHADRATVLADRRMERRCEECHRHTAGPFVFEHEAGRLDGCGACHAPHGSPNRRLLKSWPVRNLCLGCHPNTPPNHNLAPFSPFRECLACHTEVHGSNLDGRLFR